MEWNRSGSQTQPTGQSVHHTGGSHKKKLSLLNMRTLSVGLVVCIAILILAITYSVFTGGPVNQKKYVDGSRVQAVFLNGGQVYFGKIGTLNDKFMRVNEIYYLRVNQTVQPDGSAATGSNQDISLVKLGCELHGPQDSMVINQEQVIFWENLKDDGQVAKAVADFKKQNPDGQKCETNTQAPASNIPATKTP